MANGLDNRRFSGGIDELCINTMRFLAVDAVEKASSGHPGMPMGDAPMAYVLWRHFLRHSPKNPKWPGRDRFVLSAGHGSMLLYSLLHLTGYELSLDDLKKFRQWGSKTPGHPECEPERGIETTTGPLGQGFANGVGMAIAERYLAERYNRPGYRLFDYTVYAITSDGDIMEGVTSEAASIAGHLKLGNLVYLYSDNSITIEGPTGLSFSEDVALKFQAMGWHVEKAGGYDLEGLKTAIAAAKAETKRPSLVIVKTRIGYGSPGKEDSAEAHGAPLGKDEARLAKEKLGWPPEREFFIPDEALEEFRKALPEGESIERQWDALFEKYGKEYPELAKELKDLIEGRFPSSWENDIPVFGPKDGPMATRSASGKVINAISKNAPFLIGGSADLAPSTNTHLNGFGDFSPDSVGRNLHFGVREHAMGSILNGMALCRMLIPYGATFLVFYDYMRPPVRLAALMRLRVVYVFTHDSIGLGEDGPTHQPVEQLAGLRSVPNLTVIRPADANETAEAWRVALRETGGPVALVLTRQALPVIDRKKYQAFDGLKKGAYVLADPADGMPEVIFIATGSEVHLALGAYEELGKRGVKARVVSMPCWELFERQTEEYRKDVLPPAVKARVSIEAGSSMGWHKYTGDGGAVISVDRFGASSPYKTIFEKFGFTVEGAVNRALGLLEKSKAG